MLLLVTVLIILMLILIAVKLRTKNVPKTKYSDVPIDELLNDADIDTTTPGDPENDDVCVLPDTELADISYDAQAVCVNPRNGMCLYEDNELVDGCCKLELNENSDKTEMAFTITSTVLAMIVVDITVQSAIRAGSTASSAVIRRFPAVRGVASKVISKVTGELASSVASRLALSKTARQAARELSKQGSKAVTKALVAASYKIGVKMGLKASAKATMTSAKAMMGPLGWAMLAFDAVSMGLDITDPQGYSTFMSNKYLKDMVDAAEYDVYEVIAQTDYGWPLIFDIKNMYITEFVAAYESTKLPFIEQALNDVLSCKPIEVQLDISAWFDEYTERVLKYLNKDPQKRDEKIYAHMVDLLGDNAKNIKLYPFLSKTNTVGVTLSAEGVDAWNAMTDAERLEKINASDPESEPSTEDNFKDFKVVMADTYRVPANPRECRTPHKLLVDHIITAGKQVGSAFSGGAVDASECVPKMNEMVLPEEVPMYVVKFVEKICLQGTDGLIKETTGACGDYKGEDYGVTWNPNKNLCNYTRLYCDRMGLSFDSKKSDCDLYPGQDEVELFFPTGTTITRNVMRYAIAVNNCDSEEVRRSKSYDNVHACRVGELTMVGAEIDKYKSIDACKANHGGYRNEDECMAARSLQAIASSALYFVPGGFISKMFMGECDMQWAGAMIEGLVDAGKATGDFFEGDFTDFFEEDFTDFFEDDVSYALNPTNW